MLRHLISLGFWLHFTRFPSVALWGTLWTYLDFSLQDFLWLFLLYTFGTPLKSIHAVCPCMCHTLSDILEMRMNINQRKSRKVKVTVHMHYHTRWRNFSFCILIFSIVNVVGTYALFNVSDLLKVGFIFFSRSLYLNKGRQFKQDNVPETWFYRMRSAQNALLVVPLLNLV